MIRIGLIDRDTTPNGDHRFQTLRDKAYGHSEYQFFIQWKSLEEFTNVILSSGSSALDTIARIIILDSAFGNLASTADSLVELVKFQQAVVKSGVKSTKIVLMTASIDLFDKVRESPDKYMLYGNFIITKAERDSGGHIDLRALNGVVTGSSDASAYSITTAFRDDNDKMEQGAQDLKKKITPKSDLAQKLNQLRENAKKEEEAKKKEHPKVTTDEIKKSIKTSLEKDTHQSVLDILSDEMLAERARLDEVDTNYTYRGKLVQDKGFVFTFGDFSSDWSKHLFQCAEIYSSIGKRVLFINLTNGRALDETLSLDNFKYEQLPDSLNELTRYDMQDYNQVDLYMDYDNLQNELDIVKWFYHEELMNLYDIVFINLRTADFRPIVESVLTPLLNNQIIIYGEDNVATAYPIGNQTSPVIKLSGLKIPIMRLYNRISSKNITHNVLKNSDGVLYRSNMSIIKNLFLGQISYTEG